MKHATQHQIKDTNIVLPTTATARRAPDSIMSELWAVKAQMNADAGYDVDRLLANVHQMAQRSRGVKLPSQLAV
jgi:hypothetical protein